MADETTIDAAQIAADYRAAQADALPGYIVDSAVDHLVATAEAKTASYPATGSIASLILYIKCQCTVKGGKTFDGSIWGVSTPGGGALIGDVYTDNIDALYANTTNFVLVATPVYTTFIFRDKDGNTLGSFQAGAVSTVVSPPLSGGGSWH